MVGRLCLVGTAALEVLVISKLPSAPDALVGGGAVPSRPTKKVHKNLLAVMTVILDESFLVGVVSKHLYLTMNKMAYFRPLANKQQRSQNYHLFTCHLFSSLPGVSSLLPSPPSKLCHWRNREGRNAQ